MLCFCPTSPLRVILSLMSWMPGFISLPCSDELKIAVLCLFSVGSRMMMTTPQPSPPKRSSYTNPETSECVTFKGKKYFTLEIILRKFWCGGCRGLSGWANVIPRILHGEGGMLMEAVIGVMQPKERSLQKLGGAKNGFLPPASRKKHFCLHLTLALWTLLWTFPTL